MSRAGQRLTDSGWVRRPAGLETSLSRGARILLARHGETADNVPPVRLMGRRDPPLTERGVQQAHELARAAERAGVAAVFTSPMRRAFQTAEVVARAMALRLRSDERLIESSRGSWEGRLVEAIAREDPERWAAWQRPRESFRFPGGESLGEHIARVSSALADIAGARQPALVVCHGGTIRCALMSARGIPAEYFHEIRVPHATLIPLAGSEPSARSMDG